MKLRKILSLLLATVLISGVAYAQKSTAIPKEKEGRWGVFTYNDAAKEAVKKRQPIVLLALSQGSKEEPENLKKSAEQAFWALEKGATMVVIPHTVMSKAKVHLTAEGTAALSSAAGKDLPRLVVMDATGTVVLGALDKEKLIGADEKSLKDFAKTIAEANRDPKTAASASASASPGAVAPATTTAAAVILIKGATLENWTNNEGKQIQATLLEASPTEVVLQLANGNKVNYPLANLNAGSQKRVEELKAASK